MIDQDVIPCLPWVAHILEASAIVFTVGVLHAGWVERGVPQRRGGGGRVGGGGGGQGGGGQEVEQHRGQDRVTDSHPTVVTGPELLFAKRFHLTSRLCRR